MMAHRLKIAMDSQLVSLTELECHPSDRPCCKGSQVLRFVPGMRRLVFVEVIALTVVEM